MLSTRLNKTILSIISVTSLVSSLAMAQLTPGPGHGGSGGGNPPPKYNPCSVPTDPNCHGGGGGNPGHGGGNPGHNPGNPGNPGHGGNPGYPSNPPLKPGPSHPTQPSYPTYPTYPSQPTYPTYPSQPSYPNYPSHNFGSYTLRAINHNLGGCTVRTDVSGWANQIYIYGQFSGNFENGTRGYNQDAQLENALRTHAAQGACGSIGGYDSAPSYPDYPSYPYPTDGYPDYSSNTIVRRVPFNAALYNQSIDLRRLFNLDQQSYAGYRVVSVTASTTPNSPAVTIANLIVNGYVMASERNPGYEISLSPAERVRLDDANTYILLGITGSTYINELQITLTRY